MIKKNVSGVLLTLLALSTSFLAFNIAVKQTKAQPNPWEMPIVYLETITPAAGKLKLTLAIYNLSNTFYSTDEEWVQGGPLPPYSPGPVTRYNYSLGNLYAFDISIRWNPAVLSYVSHMKKVPVQTYPGGILNSPVLLAVDDVDAVAGTYRIAYTSNFPAAPFNAENESAQVFSMMFNVLSAGDNGLSIDSISLVVDNVRFPSAQPVIPWRTVISGIEAGAPNKKITGGPFSTNVIVVNNESSEHVYDITIYANTMVVGSTSVSVPAYSTKTVNVACSIAGLVKGNYILKADGLPIGGLFVTLAGDVDGNRAVNIFDIVKMAGVYGIKNTDIRYDPYCDLDNDGDTDIFDIVQAAGNYGKSW